jgi:hypothetical protein
MVLLDIFRDGIWNFVGVILALIAILISLYLNVRNSKRKRLSYKFDSYIIFELDENLHNDVKILFKEKPVSNIKVFLFELKNTGKIAIQEDDFVAPITLTFNEKAEILNIEKEFHPPNISSTISNNQNEILINRTLLNKNDVIKLKILLSNSNNDFNLSSRINNINAIKNDLHKIESKGKLLFLISITTGALTIILALPIWLIFKYFPDSSLVLTISYVMSIELLGTFILRKLPS